ncbi:MAG: hypothetical protein GX086_06595 [Alcaligenaceae bacterium]|nr:hypothetical protein [Alcaligenaceae bacterium]
MRRIVMWKKIFSAAIVCLSLTACETMGTSQGTDKYSAAGLKQNIKIGVSTPQDIRAVYGNPEYTQDGPDGPTYWSYSIDELNNSLIDTATSFIPVFGASTAANAAKRRRSLDIFFEKNRVRDYSITESR